MRKYRDRKCEACDKVYTPSSPKQKTCGDKECAKAIRRIRERKLYRSRKNKVNKECPLCGTEFYTSDLRRKYCGSPECDEERIRINNVKSSAKRGLTNLKNKKEKYKVVKKNFESLGYELLSDEYVSTHKKLKYRCPNGHVNFATWANFNSGKRCPDCYGNKKYTLEEIKEKYAEFGYTVTSDRYRNGYQNLEYICPNGHTGHMKWFNFRAGKRCPECQGRRVLDIDRVRKSFEKEGYILLTTEYKRNDQPLKYICPEGHVNTTIFANFDNHGKRCPDCAGNKRFEYEYVKSVFDERGYTLVSTDYTNNRTSLEYICPEGHNGSTTFHRFLNKNHECPLCTGYTSAAEREIYEYVCDLVGSDNVIHNDRDFISPQELDIYIPDKNLAIEYCGLYWHSEVSGGKSKDYHYRKMAAVNDKGVRLITVFEDEYKDRPKQVLSRIQNALGVGLKRIYARKCEVRELFNREDIKFLQEHHLQGKSGARKRWGLFYEDELVSVMSVGTMSRTHAAKIKNNPDAKVLELKRFAHKTGCTVIGGASRLFKRVKEYAIEEGFTHIKSYCDMRYGNHSNAVYEKLGFELLCFTKWTPHYVKYGKRYRNQGLRKTPEERLTGKTEWELRKEQGYDRVYDVGHRTYLYTL